MSGGLRNLEDVAQGKKPIDSEQHLPRCWESGKPGTDVWDNEGHEELKPHGSRLKESRGPRYPRLSESNRRVPTALTLVCVMQTYWTGSSWWTVPGASISVDRSIHATMLIVPMDHDAFTTCRWLGQLPCRCQLGKKQMSVQLTCAKR